MRIRTHVAIRSFVLVLPDTGHWLMEERPKETAEALTKFFSNRGLRRRQ